MKNGWKEGISLLLTVVMLLSILPAGLLTAAAEELAAATEQTVITIDFNEAASQGLSVTDFTLEEDGWEFDAENSYDVKPVFYQNANWDYSCLRLTQTAANGTGVLNLDIPAAGTYKMDLTYCVGNNANDVEATIGGTTTSYFAWANWGTAPKSVSTEGVVLEKGSNEISFTTPASSTAVSLILVKEITLTLVEAAPVEATVVTIDFNAEAAEGKIMSAYGLKEDGWSYDYDASYDVTPTFYQNSNWDYKCLRLTQNAANGTAYLNIDIPVSGVYQMDLTYCVGNNGNYVDAKVGGTTTSYFAWANWGTAPKSVTAEGVALTAGANHISFSTPATATATSLIMVKDITFTLVEAADESKMSCVVLDFNAAAGEGKAVTAFTVEEDGWAINTEKTVNSTTQFFSYEKDDVVWDYSCLRFSQKASGASGAVDFYVPESGAYKVDLTYCTGNSGNETELIIGDTTLSYHAWANWGAAPKSIAAYGVQLETGVNTLTVSCPAGSASYMMLKEVRLTKMGGVTISSQNGLTMRPDNAEGITLLTTGTDAIGREMDLTDAEIVYESLNSEIVQVSTDGIATPVAAGSAEIQVTVTMPDGTVHTAKSWVTVTTGKTAATYYTQEKRDAAVYNAYTYGWGKKARVRATKEADVILENLELYYDLIPFEGIPRAEAAGMTEDPEYQVCPMCNVDLSVEHGNYAWLTDPVNEPWKVICPECDSRFPSNDFASYYQSGLDAQGVFHAENADEQYLVNELYPEKGDGWGVDDGWGWITGETYTNAGGGTSPRIYAFVACYNGFLWGGANNCTSVNSVLNSLRDAYLYTGDIKYGRAGAILIDRVADVYPTMSLTDHVYFKPRSNASYLTVSTLPEGTIPFVNNQGTYFQGKILGCISEGNYLAKNLLKAYDAFYPAFDDPQVIDYLSAKAEEQGLAADGDNPKDTPQELRENGIYGLVHEVSEGVRNRDIWGNFGLPQSSMAFAAVILDSDEQLSEPVDEPLNMATGDRRLMNSDEMIAWLFEDGPHAQKNMFDKLLTDISRDGHGDEVSPSYHLTWMRNFIDYADAMDGYEGYPGADLYENSRFVKMLVGNLALTAGGNTTLQNGDSGTAGGVKLMVDQNPIVRAFQATGNVELAQALYYLNGNKSEGLVGDMFDPEAGQLEAKVQAVVDEYGTYDVNKSVLLPGYGQALLKDVNAEGENESLYALWFGRIAGGHGNRNALDLSLFAYGLNFSPALGYPKAANNDYVRQVWQRGTISRNTVIIDDASQTNYTYLTQYHNEDVYHFDDAGYVKVADASGKKAYADVAEEYRRTIVTVQGDDDAHYAVDFFRVLGGSTHLYSFHAAATDYPVSDNIETVAQSGGTYAGADVQYGAEAENGYSFLYDVQTDNAPDNNFYLDYTIVDHRKVLSDATGLHLRLNMLSTADEPFTEVTFAKGNPPARENNPEYYPYSLIRKDGGDSLFTAVYEPYKTDRYLSTMELAQVVVTEGTLSENDRVAAVKVLRTDGKAEYIVYSTNYDVTLRVDDRFDFSGFVGVVTYESDADDAKICFRYGMDATNVAGELQAHGAVTGQVADFTKELGYENSITVTMDQAMEPETLVGRVIYVENDGTENGAYIIEGAVAEGDNVVLDLGDQSLIRSLADPADVEGGYVYNIAQGQSYRIPMSVSEVPACEHSNTTTETVSNSDKTHTTTATCSDCGEVVSTETADCSDEDKDTLCDVCGATIVELTLVNVGGSNMTLGNDLKMNFMVKTAELQDGLTMRVTQDGKDPVVLTPEKYNSTYHYVAYSVAAKEMTDILTVEVLNADGYVISEPYTRTIAYYATNLLTKSTSTDKLKSVAVDMLNYGTEAQKYFSYNEDDYANANISAEDQTAYATTGATCDVQRVLGTNAAGTNLSLEASILLNVFFNSTTTDGMTATVTYTNYKGEEKTAEAAVEKYSSSRVKVVVDEIVLADTKRPVTVTVYKDGAEYGSCTEAVGGYATRKLEDSTMGSICQAILNFATSAYTYLGGTH